MKASEIIERLQELIKKHGDCDVGIYIEDDEYNYEHCADISEIDYESRIKEFSIR